MLANSEGHKPKRTAMTTTAVRNTRSMLTRPTQRQISSPRPRATATASKSGKVGPQIEYFVVLGGANRFLRDRLAADGIAGNDVNADIAGTAHHIVHHRAVQNLEPARACRFADHDLRDVVGLRIADHVVGDVAIAARQRDRFAAERFDEAERVGDAVAFLLGQLQAAPPST